jgi:predicted SprT family Zn-dependent metalloprotease
MNADLQMLYSELNTEYFDGVLPTCRVTWSRRLTRAAGNIYVRRRLIRLSWPLLVESYQSDSLFGPEYEVCGVLCDSADMALREILKHEMIHLWLHERGLPSGHTQEFRDKARAMGQPKTRHRIDVPMPKTGWIYHCLACGIEFTRRRRYGRTVACAQCCKVWNGGKFDDRFKLRGRRIVAS